MMLELSAECLLPRHKPTLSALRPAVPRVHNTCCAFRKPPSVYYEIYRLEDHVVFCAYRNIAF
jgi:hypothetical protein